jgi:hypothetical protein
MLNCVPVVRTDVSEELISSVFGVTRIGELGTLALHNHVILRGLLRLLVTANVPISRVLVTLMIETVHSSETSFLQEPNGVISKKEAFFNDT